jgi:hypothetical protein
MDDYKKRSFRRLNKNCKKTNCPALLQFSSSRIWPNIHLGKHAGPLVQRFRKARDSRRDQAEGAEGQCAEAVGDLGLISAAAFYRLPLRLRDQGEFLWGSRS